MKALIISKEVIKNVLEKETENLPDDFTFDIKLWTKGTQTQIKEFIYGGDIKYIYLHTNNDNYGVPTDSMGSVKFDGIKKIFETNLKSIVSKMLIKQKMLILKIQLKTTQNVFQ